MEIPVAEFGQLESHLATCPECRALADVIVEAEGAIGLALDDFAAAGSFEDAWQRAERAEVVPVQGPWARRSVIGLAALAAAAVLALALTASRPSAVSGQAGETVVARWLGQSDVVVSPPPSPAADEHLDEGTDAAPRPGRAASRVPRGARASEPDALAVLNDVSELQPPGGDPERSAAGDERIARTLATCGQDLEPRAIMGRLDAPSIACVEAVYANTQRLTERDRVSRLLLANAWAAGDHTRWEQLVKRHLDEVSRADPDLCYKYAAFLSRRGVSRAEGVVRWSEVALENKDRWQGDTYTTRVYGLLKLRSRAAELLWRSAEERAAVTADDEARDSADRARALAATFAREWLDYARAANLDDTLAFDLCVSTAGAREACAE